MAAVDADARAGGDAMMGGLGGNVVGTKIGGGDGINVHIVDVSARGIDVPDDPALAVVGNGFH